MSKHDQGAWRIAHNHKGDLIVAGVDQVCIIKQKELVDNSTDLANANLIAAAPELLEALEIAIDELETFTPYEDEDRIAMAVWHSKIKAMKGVIAKARGEG